jgi:CHAD domain-containing protein
MSIGRADLLRKRLDVFTRSLRSVQDEDMRAVHQTRVASRRLRELLPILQLESDRARKLNRRLRKVTRRLGAVRELDVLLLLIDELHVSRRDHASAISRVAMMVAKERDDARQRLAQRLPIGFMTKLAKKLDRAAEDVAARDGETSRSVAAKSWRWAIEARLARRADRLAAAMADAGAVYLPERLHTVRIALKKLRYAAEASADLAGRRHGGDIRALKRAQDTLGRMHDVQVLIDRVRQVQASLTPPDLAVWRALDGLVILLDNTCRQLHGRYISRRTELQAIAGRLGKERSAPATLMRRIVG